jgi:hypothetical protein
LQKTIQPQRLLSIKIKVAFSRIRAGQWDGNMANVEVAIEDKNSPLLGSEALGVLWFDINPILSTAHTIDPV